MKELILMADIIQSSSKAGKPLMEQFRDLVHQTNQQFKNSIRSPLTITLGDEFQGIVKDLPTAISILFFMEEQLIAANRPFSLRYVLNEGEIDTPINEKEAYQMLGSGLKQARMQLNDGKKSENRFFITLDDKDKSVQLNHSLYLYHYLIAQWHEKDFPFVTRFLEGQDYKEVAKKLNRDESSTWRREKSLGIRAYTLCKELTRKLAG